MEADAPEHSWWEEWVAGLQPWWCKSLVLMFHISSDIWLVCLDDVFVQTAEIRGRDSVHQMVMCLMLCETYRNFAWRLESAEHWRYQQRLRVQNLDLHHFASICSNAQVPYRYSVQGKAKLALRSAAFGTWLSVTSEGAPQQRLASFLRPSKQPWLDARKWN